MDKRISAFFIIEVLLIVCLGLAAFTEVYYLTFLLLLLYSIKCIGNNR